MTASILEPVPRKGKFPFIPKDDDSWHTPPKWGLRFALLPTRVGITPEGKILRVWLEFYVASDVSHKSYYANPDEYWVIRRPLRHFDGLKPYFWPDRGVNDEAYKGQ